MIGSNFKKTLFFLIFTQSILTSISSFASITNVSVTGAVSNYVTNLTSSGSGGTTTPVTSSYDVFGGIGNGKPCVAAESSTCNTCTDTTNYGAGAGGPAGQNNKACNPVAIGPNSLFTITFTSSVAGTSAAMYNTTTQVPNQLPNPTYTINQPVSLTFKWGAICQTLGDSGCAVPTSNNISLSVGVSTGSSTLADSITINFHLATILDTASAINGGLQDFNTFPGDQKTYIKNLFAFNSNFTTGSTGANIIAVAAFSTLSTCSVAGTEADLILNDVTPTLLPVDATGNLSERRILNEENGQEYLFKVAMQDQAKNIGLFTATPQSAAGGTHSCARFYQTSIPDPVYGLLNDGSNCFIATAAYGSDMDSRVQVFRDFRDMFLMKSAIGKKLVVFYYAHSPPLAKFIAKAPALRAISRAFLYPLLGMASLYVSMGSLLANLILTLLFVGLLILSGRKKLGSAK